MEYKYVEKTVLQTKEIILNKTSLTIKRKEKNDFVTDIDITVSDFLKRELNALFPQIKFFSEEEEGCLHDNCWILDPIDGTTNLIYGYNFSSVSLGHYLNGKIVYGIVYNPFSGEIFTAERGKGSFLNHTIKLQTSKRVFKDSLIEFGAGSTHKEFAEKNFEIVKDIFKQCLDIRRICSSALDLCYIASGRIDGYFEEVLKPWDIAAGSLILEEAGGLITDYSGNSIQFSDATSVIASNGMIQESLIDIIKKHI